MSDRNDRKTAERGGLGVGLHVGLGCLFTLLVFSIYRFGLGVRGLSPESTALLERISELAPDLAWSMPPNTLDAAHPLVELLGALWVGGAGGEAHQLVSWGGPALIALSLPPIFWMASRRAGPAAGWIAALLFASTPAVVGAATAGFAGPLVVCLWAWFLGFSSSDVMPWWLAGPLWLLAGALVLAWPPAAVWLVLWLVVQLTAGQTSTEPSNRRALSGRIARPSMSFGQLLAPVAAPVLVSLMHPGFREGLGRGWQAFAFNALSRHPESFQWGGFVYEQARPPLWTGLGLLWWAFPAAFGVAAMVGWFAEVRDLRGVRAPEGGAIMRLALIWGLPFTLGLPWLIRGGAWGAVSVMLVMSPLVAVLAAVLVVRLGEDIFTRIEKDRRVLNTALATLPALVLTFSVVVATARTHPSQGSHYNGLWGGLPSAVAAGHPVSRDEVLPLDVLREFAEDVDGGIYVVDRTDTVDAYRRAGWLPDGTVHTEPVEAGGTLRMLEAFAPGDGSKPAGGMLLNTGERLRWKVVDDLPIYFLEPRTTP